MGISVQKDLYECIKTKKKYCQLKLMLMEEIEEEIQTTPLSTPSQPHTPPYSIIRYTYLQDQATFTFTSHYCFCIFLEKIVITQWMQWTVWQVTFKHLRTLLSTHFFFFYCFTFTINSFFPSLSCFSSRLLTPPLVTPLDFHPSLVISLSLSLCLSTRSDICGL